MQKIPLAFLKHKFIDPLKEFLHDSRAIGMILLACTILSLTLANISGFEAYVSFWLTEVDLFHSFHLPHTIVHWINDGLMALFFFLAGMEIKRELIEGELSSMKRALLPVFAAIGGMIMPAIIYTLFNKGSIHASGWAIPTATDIAFSLGIASLLGKRVPVSLKIFLTALAIIDDLGAIIVIALFYGSPVKFMWLIACVAVIIILVLLFKKYNKVNIVHLLLGVILWYCMFNSGVHATVAGVVFAFLIPSEQLKKWELKLHHPVYFFIMPLFALANTAIVFPENIGSALHSNLSWGIMLGLFLGKPLGICLMCWYLVKRKLAVLPSNTNWQQLIGAGILAGIGFTMSIFIATLAFADTTTQDVAKISVLFISGVSIVVGYVWFRIIHINRQL